MWPPRRPPCGPSTTFLHEPHGGGLLAGPTFITPAPLVRPGEQPAEADSGEKELEWGMRWVGGKVEGPLTALRHRPQWQRGMHAIQQQL